MSDLDNLQALKRMLEHKDEEEAQKLMEREKKFIADATRAYLGTDTPITGIQGYDPDKMMEFLNQSPEVVKEKMGGEWKDMDDISFEAFAYTVNKKIKKSTSLLDWSN